MMNRRTFLASTLATLAPLPALAAPRGPVGKKGWAGGDADLHKQFKVNWYYNWMIRGNSDQIPFVPLFKSGPTVNEQSIGLVREIRGLDAILGFNEPEREKQGNLSVDEALELWPALEKLAVSVDAPLSSPACSSDKHGMDWFEEFMEKAKRQKLKIDFLAVHWYRSRNADAFEDFIKDLSRSHGRRKVWVKEFNGWAGTEKENYEFLKGTLKFMERSDIVERYAYFEPGAGKAHSLLKTDGSLTRMGELYRDTGTE